MNIINDRKVSFGAGFPLFLFVSNGKKKKKGIWKYNMKCLKIIIIKEAVGTNHDKY